MIDEVNIQGLPDFYVYQYTSEGVIRWESKNNYSYGYDKNDILVAIIDEKAVVRCEF